MVQEGLGSWNALQRGLALSLKGGVRGRQDGWVRSGRIVCARRLFQKAVSARAKAQLPEVMVCSTEL